MDIPSSIQFEEYCHRGMLASSNQGEIVSTSDIDVWI